MPSVVLFDKRGNISAYVNTATSANIVLAKSVIGSTE